MKTRSKLALLLLPVAIINSSALEVDQPNVSVAAAASALHTQTATEIARMQNAGVEKQVIIAYLQNVHVPYKATAEDVLYLHQQKVPDEVILEWITRSGALSAAPAQAATPQNEAQAGPARSPDLVAANTPPNPPVIQQQQPQPQPQQQTVIQTQPAIVTVPSVVSVSSWPSVSLGVSWGSPSWGVWGGPWVGGWGSSWCGPWRPGWGVGWSGAWRSGWGGHPGWGGGWHGGGHWSGGHGGWRGGAHFTSGGGGHGGGRH